MTICRKCGCEDAEGTIFKDFCRNCGRSLVRGKHNQRPKRRPSE